jgi:hypothetical protein
MTARGPGCVCGDATCRYRHDHCACGALKRRTARFCRPCFEARPRFAHAPATGRVHAVAKFDIAGEFCEWSDCLDPAVDRHHRDGDTFNNTRENVAFLCRRHHQVEHGRGLEHGEGRQQPCVVCGHPYAPLRMGRCGRCNSHYRRWGHEFPERGSRDLRRVRLGEPEELVDHRITAGTMVMPSGVAQNRNRTVRGWIDGSRFYWIGQGRRRQWIDL